MARDQRLRQLRKSNRTWDAPALPPLAGVAGGSLLSLMALALDFGASFAPLWAFLFGFLALALPLYAVQSATARVTREIRALVNVRPFTGTGMIGVDDWAMTAVFAEQVLSLVDEGPEHVVELGSGQSTVLIAQRLEARGHGHVTAVEHLEAYAARTRAWLRDRGLDHRATVIHAPIEERQVDGRRQKWYAEEPLSALPHRIDLLVVDGPPNILTARARWPAVPLLADRLASGAVIFMDDGDRRDETRAALDWNARLGGRIRYMPGGKGGWLLRLPGAGSE